jgi:hypothetical protein
VGIQRYTVTITAGDPIASLSLRGGSCVTIELTGGGSVSHTVRDTGVEVKNIAANEAYDNEVRENTFTLTPGTSALITVDEKIIE